VNAAYGSYSDAHVPPEHHAAAYDDWGRQGRTALHGGRPPGDGTARDEGDATHAARWASDETIGDSDRKSTGDEEEGRVMELIPAAIPLLEYEPNLFGLPGVAESPDRAFSISCPGRFALQRLSRTYIDSTGRQRGVYEVVGFAQSILEAYPWLGGE